jgi:hypothetical protein
MEQRAPLRGGKHLLQRIDRDVVVRGVTDRFPARETNDLRRLVGDPSAFGDRQRQRAVFSDQDLDAPRTAVLLCKVQELGPSSGGNRSGRRVLEQQHRLVGANTQTPLKIRRGRDSLQRHLTFSFPTLIKTAMITKKTCTA